MELKIASFNCGSIKRKVETVKNLLSSQDIVLLQETFLTEDETNYLELFSDQFDFASAPSVINENYAGRPQGGLAIFYNKILNKNVKICKFSNRILAIQIISNNMKLIIFNVYFPCDYRNVESLAQFRECLAELTDIIECEKADFIVIAGDMNCDPHKGRFFSELNDFMQYFNFTLTDLALPSDTFTYIGSDHNCCTSWIDHVIASHTNLINNINVQYGSTLCDHIPITFNLCLPNNVTVNEIHVSQTLVNEFIKWDKLSDANRKDYAHDLSCLLNHYSQADIFQCTTNNCNLTDHKHKLDALYDRLCYNVKRASLPLKTTRNNNKFKAIPGWNSHCKELHAVARNAFLAWKNNGKIRSGNLFENMKETRSNFKRALDYCKNNETNIKKNRFLQAFNCDTSRNTFWKEIKKLNPTKNKVPVIMDNKTTPIEIANVFSDKYKSILDDPLSQTKPNDFENYLSTLQHSNQIVRNKILLHEMKDAINSLNPGIGHDGIHVNHIKFGGQFLMSFLSKLFSSFIQHGHVPKSMLIGEIRPIIKNVMGDVHSSDNYRPVMSSSSFLKLFEYCLLFKLEKYIKLNSRQFGFRKFTSCEMPITILKETISNYNKSNSNVHCAFLDLTKAFDKINHNILITKMLDESIPPLLIKTIKSMYDQQYAHVKFGNVKSNSWKIGNGVRQGAIISPLLFNLYINDILNAISELDPGCSIGYYKTNILGYADDVVLASPSSKGLQVLIDKFSFMLDAICLKINANKTYYMIFKCKKYKKFDYDNHILLKGVVLQRVHQCKYLGVILSETLNLALDIKRMNSQFLKQFFGMYRKFSFNNWAVLGFLFQSYCTSFYGSNLWYDKKYSQREFRALSVSYHKCIKLMLRLPIWESNHYACNIAGLPIFKHLINKKILCYFFNIINSKSPCLSQLLYYLKFDSHIAYHVKLIFQNGYNVNNILVNDIDAVKARIDFIQDNERIL